MFHPPALKVQYRGYAIVRRSGSPHWHWQDKSRNYHYSRDLADVKKEIDAILETKKGLVIL